MTSYLRHAAASLKDVHQEEEGMEALQTVLIVALAAIVLAFAYKIYGGNSGNDVDADDGNNTVVGWVLSRINNIFGFK
jgi:hypothetical protein